MLKSLSRFTSSFAALLTDQNTIIDLDGRCEDIRAAMLDALMELTPSGSMDAKPTWAAIALASEVQTLWYLRSDLLRLLANCWGESTARQRLDTVTEMFRGVVPKNQMPSPRRFAR